MGTCEKERRRTHVFASSRSLVRVGNRGSREGVSAGGEPFLPCRVEYIAHDAHDAQKISCLQCGYRL